MQNYSDISKQDEDNNLCLPVNKMTLQPLAFYNHLSTIVRCVSQRLNYVFPSLNIAGYNKP